MTDAAFPSPGAAALASWDACPQAEVRIISVEYRGEDEAVVVTDTVPSHPMWNYCERTAAGWVLVADHN